MCLSAAVVEQREVEILIDLADVVFAGKHPVTVLMHHHPVVALEIGLITSIFDFICYTTSRSCVLLTVI